MQYTYELVAKTIDHSLLNPTMTTSDFERGCALAVEYDVASVCIQPHYLKRCSEILKGSSVVPGTTIGFPHGGHTTESKLAEVEFALADGGKELDMVVNINRVLSGDWKFVEEEIRAINDATHAGGAKLKVIFETCHLNDAQKIELCRICGDAGVDWVKTSTGYGTSGATIEDLKLMRKHSPADVQVKAAGGVRELDMLLSVIAAGCTRCGASRTGEMLEEFKKRAQDGVLVFEP